MSQDNDTSITISSVLFGISVLSIGILCFVSLLRESSINWIVVILLVIAHFTLTMFCDDSRNSLLVRMNWPNSVKRIYFSFDAMTLKWSFVFWVGYNDWLGFGAHFMFGAIFIIAMFLGHLGLCFWLVKEAPWGGSETNFNTRFRFQPPVFLFIFWALLLYLAFGGLSGIEPVYIMVGMILILSFVVYPFEIRKNTYRNSRLVGCLFLCLAIAFHKLGPLYFS